MKVYTRSSGVIRLDDPEDIKNLKENDLWRGLEHRRRYGSQVWWTVLQHSWLVRKLAEANKRDPTYVRQAFYHDLSEGLLGDLQKPLRDMMDPECAWERAHRLVNAELARRYDWPEGWEEHCREEDNRAFELEVYILFPLEHRLQMLPNGAPPPTKQERMLFDKAMHA